MRLRTMFCAHFLAIGLAAAAVAGETVTVEIGEEISLKAEDVSLGQVLVELSAAVPFELIERGEALEQLVSFDFEASSWEEAFRRLMRREGYTLTTDAATGQPRMLVVDWDVVGESLGLARTGGGAPGPAGGAAAEDVEARIRAVAEDVLAPPDRAGEAIARLEAAQEAFLAAQAALIKAQSSGSASAGVLAAAYEQAREAYLSAIGGLEGHDEARTVEALLPAFEIEDRDTRLKALETARWLSETGRNPEAVGHATSVFDTAEDEAVERAALEVLVRYGDQEEVMRMLEPLALKEGPNRDLAVREWLRIRDEQNAQARMEVEGDSQLR